MIGLVAKVSLLVCRILDSRTRSTVALEELVLVARRDWIRMVFGPVDALFRVKACRIELELAGLVSTAVLRLILHTAGLIMMQSMVFLCASGEAKSFFLNPQAFALVSKTLVRLTFSFLFEIRKSKFQ
jgi:hypothetical protein